jgi:spore coat polysaccharide biosynthesis protein SpsF
METQVFSTAVLQDVAQRTTDPGFREHVSLYIYRNPAIYRVHQVPARAELIARELRLTLDTPEDLTVITEVFEALYPNNPQFGLADILSFLHDNPEIAGRNAFIEQKHA